MSPDEFRRLGHRAIDWIADYWERVGDLPVLSGARPGETAAKLPSSAPETPDAWDDIWADLDRVVLPGLTHWQSPRFFGFFPANGSFPAILGDLLSTGLGVQGMLWATSPACTEIETRVLDWLGGLLGLPPDFLSTGPHGGGVIQGTASEATLVALCAARHRALRARPPGSPPPHLTMYASTQAHSSVVKAAMIAGLAHGPEDRAHLRLIGTDDRYAMRPDLLEAAVREDLAAGRTPFFGVATVGTTSTTAIDPLGPIARVCREHGLWLHVDAAFSGAACICPEFRGPIEDVGGADSFCFNPHKWLLTSFDCDCLWTRDRDSLVGALSVTPEYLRNAASASGEVIDYRDWQVPLGRRFRALKLWLVLRHYGAEGLRAYIRGHVRSAEVFEALVRADSRFEVVTPRTSSLVCFRLRPQDGEAPAETDARNRRLLEAINASGRAYLTHTVLPPVATGGPASAPRYVLRMAIGATLTEERHVREAWELIRDLAS
jgi:aromatic-L-amino-acid decarboxylase